MSAPNIIEVALLLLVAFLIGAAIGYWVRCAFFTPRRVAGDQDAAAAQPAATTPATAKSETVETTAPVAQAPAAKAARAAPAKPAPAKPAAKAKPAAAKAKPASKTKAASGTGSTRKTKPATAASTATGGSRKKPATATAKTSKAKAKPEAPATADAAAVTSEANRPTALGAPRDGKKDDLKQIKGIGPKIETTLNGLGIFHFDQVADWNRDTVAWVDNYLSFKGRIDREDWIAQAGKLAKR